MTWSRFTIVCIACWVSAFVHAQPNTEGFERGHLFLPEYRGGGEMCAATRKDYVVEFDPATGESWFLADRSDGLCGLTGLRFSPDGKRLRILSYWNARVADIDPAGNATTAHDANDGIGGPIGSNGLGWDRAGNFYVTDDYYYALLKFPADHPPSTKVGNGSFFTVTSGPDGNVYIGRGGVYRMDQWGRIERFGDLTRVACIEFDPLGNLFVATWLLDCAGVAIHAYNGVDPSSRRLVSTGFTCGNYFAITFCEDPDTLYAVTESDGVYAVYVPSGESALIYNSRFVTAGGLACYVPPKKGDLNCDRWVNAFDIDPFIAAVMGEAAYDALAPHCDRSLADLNDDGSVNAFDIDAFIELLTG